MIGQTKFHDLIVLNAWDRRKYEKTFMQFVQMKALADMQRKANSAVPVQGTAAGVNASNDSNSVSAATSGVFANTPIDHGVPAMQHQPAQASNQQDEHAAAMTLNAGSTPHHFGKEIAPSKLNDSFQNINLKNFT